MTTITGVVTGPGSHKLDVSTLRDDSSISRSYVLFEGFSCLSVHWGLCFGLSMVSLFVSLLLFFMLEDLSGGNEDSDVDDDREGGWEFVEAAMIFGA